MWFPSLEGCIGMVSGLGKDERGFDDFDVWGRSLVISVFRGKILVFWGWNLVFWGRILVFLLQEFVDFGVLGSDFCDLGVLGIDLGGRLPPRTPPSHPIRISV